ncbi:hypothetical protein AB2B41_11075 [Marimonas sp. MJW-29]|uniref:YcxB-like protein domain-containing protein n=1 Tax=Sulfitobacter sediminis TaxID=3234186 RepID=A0ABV3RMG1_9RHOB
MLIVTQDTLRNPQILKVRQLPRKFFGRVAVWPKGRIGIGGTIRLLAEFQAIRYLLILSPLLVIGLLWNVAALPIAQAPILMVVMIWFAEMHLLRVPARKRARLIDAAEAARGLDLLKVQSRDVLTRIAALRGMRAGQLHLVVEQSELWRFSPLTYVSVQSEDGPEVLRLSAEERQIIEERLFRAPLTERLLQRINQSENLFLRDIPFDTKGVSAHARLAAALA